LFLDHKFPITNARGTVKGFEDEDFCHVCLERKQRNCPLYFFLKSQWCHPKMTSINYFLTLKFFHPKTVMTPFGWNFLLVGIFRCKRYEQANREAYKELFDFFCEL